MDPALDGAVAGGEAHGELGELVLLNDELVELRLHRPARYPGQARRGDRRVDLGHVQRDLAAASGHGELDAGGALGVRARAEHGVRAVVGDELEAHGGVARRHAIAVTDAHRHADGLTRGVLIFVELEHRHVGVVGHPELTLELVAAPGLVADLHADDAELVLADAGLEGLELVRAQGDRVGPSPRQRELAGEDQLAVRAEGAELERGLGHGLPRNQGEREGEAQ